MNTEELAAVAGVSFTTLRSYQKQRLIPPPKPWASQYRGYSDLDVERVKFIHLCKSARAPLSLIQQLVTAFDDEEDRYRVVADLAKLKLKAIELEIDNLRRTEKELQAQLERWGKGEPPTVFSMLSALYALR